MSVEQIVDCFKDLKDPRCDINKKYSLACVVVIAMMAVLAGASGPTSIAEWAKLKEEFLKRQFGLQDGAPRKDVFRRVLMLLNPIVFQKCFAAWLSLLRDKAQLETEIDQPVCAIDGKSARRSHNHSKGLGALHAVSAWLSEHGLSLGQVACEEKSNEITAIPELLRLINIEGTIITIDAMGAQTQIAAQIIEQKGDYVLSLKGNQGKTHESVISIISGIYDSGVKGPNVREYTEFEKAHGRQTTRCYMHMPVPADFPFKDRWPGLRSLGMAINSTLCADGTESVEIRYFLSSLKVGVKNFARAVRSHWGIENGCHWCLDMTFREDESRIADRNLRQNISWLFRFALSLLRQHPSNKSIAGKRRGCSWNDNFLMEVLMGLAA